MHSFDINSSEFRNRIPRMPVGNRPKKVPKIDFPMKKQHRQFDTSTPSLFKGFHHSHDRNSSKHCLHSKTSPNASNYSFERDKPPDNRSSSIVPTLLFINRYHCLARKYISQIRPSFTSRRLKTLLMW